MKLRVEVALLFALALCFRGDTAPNPQDSSWTTAETERSAQIDPSFVDGFLPVNDQFYAVDDTANVDGFLALNSLIQREVA